MSAMDFKMMMIVKCEAIMSDNNGTSIATFNLKVEIISKHIL